MLAKLIFLSAKIAQNVEIVAHKKEKLWYRNFEKLKYRPFK